MKRSLYLIGILSFTIAFSGCRKEYLEPFDFSLSGTFDGIEKEFRAYEEFKGVRKPTHYYNRVTNGYTAYNNCGPRTVIKETSTSFSNAFFRTSSVEAPWEETWTISFRACVADPADIAYENMVVLGSSPILDENDHGTGVVIEYEASDLADSVLTTRLGPQPESFFSVLRHSRIEGYETDFHYITEGTFSCNLYNTVGKVIEIRNAKFRAKTIGELGP